MTKLSFLTPSAKVRGDGVAHTGTHHWIAQRLTAIALIPLGLWFMSQAMGFNYLSYEDTLLWISNPWHFSGIAALFTAALYHAFLGLQVIVEDYIHHTCLKQISLIILKLGCCGLYIVGWSFLIKIAIKGS